MFITRILTFSTCAISLCLSSLHGAVVWNEAVDGDLSDNPALPTKITIIVGDNTIIGSISGPIVGNVSGYDEATFTVPDNTEVFSVTLESYGPDATNTSLLNLYEGAVGADLGNLLASASLEVDHIGANLVSAPTALVPLAGPLGPGDYTLDIREGGATQNYQVTISANVIPEPSSILFIGLGASALAFRRCRRFA